MRRNANTLPQGATWDGQGTGFALFSEHATAVELCLYDDRDTLTAQWSLPECRDGVWQGYVDGVAPGQRYGFRVRGTSGFHATKLLLDPYARAVDRETRFHPLLAQGDDDSAPVAARGVVIDPSFDWGDDERPRTPWRDTVLYECHVKGLTKLHPAVTTAHRGTYLGLCAEPVIEHLLSLGVTAVQLLPVQQSFSERFLVERGLSNYWGYNPVAWFAPDIRYAADPTGAAHVREMKTMVKALHRAGLEVILDVVYNHSGEADPSGPVINLRGIDSTVYYRDIDTTGCGNSLRCEHPRVRALVLDSLRYWVQDMHVDGFRFDLAPTLARTPQGVNVQHGLFADIANDPVLSQTKLIVEPWDVGFGGHMTGGFGRPYAEWNDRYRDAVRRFWTGTSHGVGDLATRLAGSEDLFSAQGRTPLASINYVTSHDGFSLRDLVSHAHKHNLDNGWDNRDGADHEHSTNYGVEGETDRQDVIEARDGAARALLATLACSAGVPMLRQGDELGQSQRGNNNAYCQDNVLSWVSWDLDARAERCLTFARSALAVRHQVSALRAEAFYRGDGEHEKDIAWLREDGRELDPGDWHDGTRRLLVMRIAAPQSSADGALVLIANGAERAQRVRLLEEGAARSHTVLLTSGTTPAQFVDGCVEVEPRSVLLLREPPRFAERATDSGLLRALALRMGIVNSFHGHDGRVVHATDDTRVALLGAMGVEAATEADRRRSLARLEDEQHAPGLDPVRVVRAGAASADRLTFRVAGPYGARVVCHVEVACEDGHVVQRRVPGVLRSEALELTVPELAGLPCGYHRVRCVLEGGGSTQAEQALIVAPQACVDVRRALGAERGFGIVAHLYALRGDAGFGIGDFGDLRALADHAARAGAAFVGHNPLHDTNNYVAPVSPYFPLSRVFGNPIYLDVLAVPELETSAEAQALLAAPEVESELRALRAHERLDYARIARMKLRVLEALHRSFVLQHLERDTARGRAFAAFAQRHGRALRDFAAFHAIGDVTGAESDPMLDARRFPAALQNARGAEVEAFVHTHAERVSLHAYLQFEFDRQLAACQAHARAQGMALGLYGDLAVGNAPASADVWSRPELFASGATLGAPPDAYSADGQTWGLVPLAPQALRRDRYAYFSTLCDTAMRNAGLLRIDHVMGLLRQFWVPDGGNASSGAYVRFPFEDLLGIVALHSERHGTVVVGEDLGVVPEGFRERMHDVSMLRSQVMHFERNDDGSFVSPARYAREALASVNTHDLPPLAGYLRGRDIDARVMAGQIVGEEAHAQARRERDRTLLALLERLRDEGCIEPGEDPIESPRDLVLAVHRALARSESVLIAAALDDLFLELDSLNIPGVDVPQQPSWSRRCVRPPQHLSWDELAQTVLTMFAR
jgi:glycogen debranching enzyme GlgX/4-alpha-glucanotransferase